MIRSQFPSPNEPKSNPFFPQICVCGFYLLNHKSNKFGEFNINHTFVLKTQCHTISKQKLLYFLFIALNNCLKDSNYCKINSAFFVIYEKV